LIPFLKQVYFSFEVCYLTLEATVAEIPSEVEGELEAGEHANDDELHEFLESKFESVLSLCKVSLIRFLGVLLTLFSLAKVVAILSITSRHPGSLTTCFLAIAYAVSYVLFESVTWSLTSPLNRQIKNVPLENFIPLLKSVDPGDNPFTFPAPGDPPNYNEIDIQLNEVGTQNTEEQRPPNQTVPWSKAVAVIIAALGLVGPATWMVLLSHIWRPPVAAGILTGSALLFLALRLLFKYLARLVRQWKRSRLQRTHFCQTNTNEKRGRARSLLNWLIYFIRWAWKRMTSVNLFSTIWIVVVVLYFSKAFPESISGEGNEIVLPDWMVWLG